MIIEFDSKYKNAIKNSTFDYGRNNPIFSVTATPNRGIYSNIFIQLLNIIMRMSKAEIKSSLYSELGLSAREYNNMARLIL